MQLNNDVNAGDIIAINKASISSSDIDTRTLASSILRVKHNNVLDLWLDLDTNTVLPEDSLDANLTIENLSTTIMPNVELNLFYPEYLTAMPDTLISNGGDCSNITIGAGINCDSGEMVMWNLGNILPGSTSLQSIAPTVEPDFFGSLNGTVVQFFGKAQDTTPHRSFVSRSLLIGTFVPAIDSPDLIFENGFE